MAYIRKNYWGGWNRAIKSCTYNFSEICDGISRKPRKYMRYFSPKTGGLQKKKKKRSSSKLSHILRLKSEILTFFLPKIRWSPKKKKKVFIDIDSDFSVIILSWDNFTIFCRERKTILQGTINYWGGWLHSHPPSKIIGGDASPHPPRDLRPCSQAI